MGTRIVISLHPAAVEHLDAVEAWVRQVWPVTVDTRLQLPAPIATTLRTWADACRDDRTGLDRLCQLLT